MKPITREWVDKAEGDFAVMERESRARKDPNYDAVCFHAQQCVEKLIKALLIHRATSLPRRISDPGEGSRGDGGL